MGTFVDRWVGELVDSWTDGWIDRWTDRLNGYMAGWIDEFCQKSVKFHVPTVCEVTTTRPPCKSNFLQHRKKR